MPVITRYDGEPFHRFLGVGDYRLIGELRRVFAEVLGVRDPRVDYVRFEVSLNPKGMPWEEATLEDLFGWRVRTQITRVEYQLASKVRYKLARDFGESLEYALHDILKATLDLRLLDHVDAGSVTEYMGPIDWGVIEANTSALLTPAGRRLWEGHHYVLVRRRYTLEDLIARIKDRLQRLLLRS